VAAIALRLSEAGSPVLATRASAEHAHAVQGALSDAVYHTRARCIVAGGAAISKAGASGLSVGVVCAGTSDLPVAEEALVTLRFFGHTADIHADLGVAGLHRLLSRIDTIRKHKALIVVAGMEGALPSVVAGLVQCPVIAVPTSIGYGAGAGGIAALLGMLTSCASGLTVVNIDNGFGAAAAADRILRVRK
jgi:pyridinium-3,5-biscarboxylic acid mononucleotide synthase